MTNRSQSEVFGGVAKWENDGPVTGGDQVVASTRRRTAGTKRKTPGVLARWEPGTRRGPETVTGTRKARPEEEEPPPSIGTTVSP